MHYNGPAAIMLLRPSCVVKQLQYPCPHLVLCATQSVILLAQTLLHLLRDILLWLQLQSKSRGGKRPARGGTPCVALSGRTGPDAHGHQHHSPPAAAGQRTVRCPAFSVRQERPSRRCPP
jgi:hypothetical protein